jgi:hypothetical protein
LTALSKSSLFQNGYPPIEILKFAHLYGVPKNVIADLAEARNQRGRGHPARFSDLYNTEKINRFGACRKRPAGCAQACD